MKEYKDKLLQKLKLEIRKNFLNKYSEMGYKELEDYYEKEDKEEINRKIHQKIDAYWIKDLEPDSVWSGGEDILGDYEEMKKQDEKLKK